MDSEIVTFVENNDRTKDIFLNSDQRAARLEDMIYTPFQYWIIRNKSLPPSCLEYPGCYTRQFYIPQLGYKTSIRDLSIVGANVLETTLNIELTKDLYYKIWNDHRLTHFVFKN